MNGFWEGMSGMGELGGILRRRRETLFFWTTHEAARCPSAV